MGAVQLSCNHSNATFELLTPVNRLVESGEFPALITQLPIGNYKLVAQYHNRRREQTVVVKTGVTNESLVEYMFGAAILETEPPGASVQTSDSYEWGITPLSLPELSPGTLQLTLHRTGYEPVPVSLKITADQTVTFHTNLISTGYTGGMKTARQYMAAQDYTNVLSAVGDALLAKPGDAEAMTLQREATGMGNLAEAKNLGAAGDFIGGGKQLTLALQSLPDNAEAKQLLVEYKQREPEQIERERVERLNRPQKVFDATMEEWTDGKYFDGHELRTSKPLKEVVEAIASALLNVPANYRITETTTPQPETYRIVGIQDLSGVLSTTGKRQCLIVCGQTTDTETVILYKVLEYKTRHNMAVTVPLSFNFSEQNTPIHPSLIPDMSDKLKAQLQFGASNLTARIQSAIGQTPVVPPVATK